MEVIDDFWDPFFEVLLEEVLKFAGKFDACGTAAYDHHMEEPFALLGRLVFESGGFDAIHDPFADLLGISDLLQETGMLLDARYTKGSILGSDANYQHIEWHFGRSSVTFDVRKIINGNHPPLIINLRSFRLVVFYCGFLVSQDISNRLHDRPMLNGPSRT